MVAVGLSPRTESKHTIQRRVATAELTTGTEVFNRRDATRDNVVWSLRGLKSTATFTASLREARQASSLSLDIWNQSNCQTAYPLSQPSS